MVKIENHSSGLTIITEKTKSPLISIRMRVAVGSINEQDDNRGISHFVEHMVFNGTTTKTKDEITTKIENTGGMVNAYTNYNETVYIMDCLESNFDIALDTICDITQMADFPVDSVEKERNIIFQEYQDYLDDSVSVAYENAIPEFYNSEEFKTSIIGTAETIKSISREQLTDYYNRNYQPHKMILSVSGNFDKKTLDKVIKKYFYFSDISEKTKNILPVPTNNIVKKVPTKFENDTVMFYYNIPTNTIKDEIVTKLVSGYIGSGFSSLLFQRIREELGLVYRIRASFDNTAGNTGMWITTTCDSKSVDRIIDEVPKTVDEAKNITEEKLEEIKNKFLYLKIREFDSNSSNATRNLQSYVDFNDFYSFKDIKKIVNEITLDEFINVANIVSNTTPSIVASIGKTEI